jgi:two-component system, OmpR family, phosphate regulon sensor histidine kinase PhoR
MARRPVGQMMKAVVDNSNDAALGIDKEGKILFFNQQALKLFEGLKGDPVGKKIWDVMEINDFVREFSRIVKESEPTLREQVIPLYGKKILLVKMFPVKGNDNRNFGAVAILRDMTDLHKMEAKVSEFVTRVSHELKTPLTSIKGFVETLLEGTFNNPDVIRRFLQVINEETNRLTRLVINLLDMSRTSQMGNAQEVIEPVNTGEFIRGMVKLFYPIAKEKGLELKMLVPDDLPAIHINPDKFRQVIINLVDNAIKFTGVKGPGGEVEVKAQADGKFLLLNVIDTGIGIEPEEQSKIFDKFYRVTTGPSSQLGGTGLGLTITREILKAYGGTISVESEPGNGADFKFSLPFTRQEAKIDESQKIK